MKTQEERFEVTDKDRRYLQRMVASPGYRVLEKLVQGFVLTLEDQALSLSQTDPLRNKDLIADAWAYAGVGKRFQLGLDAAVKFELAKLVQSTEAPPSAEQQAADREARHRADVLGELDAVTEEQL